MDKNVERDLHHFHLIMVAVLVFKVGGEGRLTPPFHLIPLGPTPSMMNDHRVEDPST